MAPKAELAVTSMAKRTAKEPIDDPAPERVRIRADLIYRLQRCLRGTREDTTVRYQFLRAVIYALFTCLVLGVAVAAVVKYDDWMAYNARIAQ